MVSHSRFCSLFPRVPPHDSLTRPLPMLMSCLDDCREFHFFCLVRYDGCPERMLLAPVVGDRTFQHLRTLGEFFSPFSHTLPLIHRVPVYPLLPRAEAVFPLITRLIAFSSCDSRPFFLLWRVTFGLSWFLTPPSSHVRQIHSGSFHRKSPRFFQKGGANLFSPFRRGPLVCGSTNPPPLTQKSPFSRDQVHCGFSKLPPPPPLTITTTPELFL